MIYLENIQDAQVAFIPANGGKHGGELVLNVRNTMNQEQVLNVEVEDTGNSTLYYSIEVELPGSCPDGEYEYNLFCDDALVSTGIIVVGMGSRNIQYKNTLTYEQYRTE